MEKIGIILDSFSGMNKKEVEKLGFHFLPQLVIAGEKTYRSGVDLQAEDMKEILEKYPKLETSQPNPADVVEIFDKTSKKYEQVIFLSMTASLSSTYSTTMAIAADYDNVDVIETKVTGRGFVKIANEIVNIVKKGGKIDDVKKYAKEYAKNTASFVLPKDTKRLIASGRLKGAKKFILKTGKLIPVLYLTDKGFDVKGLKRTVSKMVNHSIEKAIDFLKITNLNEWVWEVTGTRNPELFDLVRNSFKNHGIKNFIESDCAQAVTANIGSGVAILVYK